MQREREKGGDKNLPINSHGPLSKKFSRVRRWILIYGHKKRRENFVCDSSSNFVP